MTSQPHAQREIKPQQGMCQIRNHAKLPCKDSKLGTRTSKGDKQKTGHIVQLEKLVKERLPDTKTSDLDSPRQACAQVPNPRTNRHLGARDFHLTGQWKEKKNVDNSGVLSFEQSGGEPPRRGVKLNKTPESVPLLGVT